MLIKYTDMYAKTVIVFMFNLCAQMSRGVSAVSYHIINDNNDRDIQLIKIVYNFR